MVYNKRFGKIKKFSGQGITAKSFKQKVQKKFPKYVIKDVIVKKKAWGFIRNDESQLGYYTALLKKRSKR